MVPNGSKTSIIFLLVTFVSTKYEVSLALSIVRLPTTATPFIHSGIATHATNQFPLHSSSALDCLSGIEHTPSPLDTPIPSDLHNRRKFINALSKTFITTAPFLALHPQPSNAAIRDPKTGILLPSPGEIEASLPTTWEEGDNPLADRDATSSFARLDSSPDSNFYTDPRFVEHVDEKAVESMTSYISDRFVQSGDSVLDLCSSWTSHIRNPGNALELKRVSGLGMNAKELEANTALTDWTVVDLNAEKNVRLPYEDGSFDKIILQLSIGKLSQGHFLSACIRFILSVYVQEVE